MIPALVALALAQGAAQAPPPEVTAGVDRTRLPVGEELVFTLRARTRSTEPLDIVLPPLSGFAIVGSRELTEVSVSGAGGPVRTALRELRLRAEQAGPGIIGPVRLRQGPHVVQTAAIEVTIDSAAAGAAALGALAHALLEAAPPPASADRVAVTVIVPDDTVLVGQQLDVVVAAWFPRALRARVHRPPQLRTPEGVWAYPPTTPKGVAASRQVRGGWLDLYVAHQVVFPLTPGTVVVPPASVEYAVPVTHSLFSREERYVLQTDTVRIAVLPLPGVSAGAAAGPAVGQEITLDLRVEPAETRVGEPIEVAATLAGVGNVPLWPEPVLRWPPGFRAYAPETVVRLEPRGGRVAGTKTFRYLGVPDSAGAFALPEVRYPYFDLAAGSRMLAPSPRRSLVVGFGLEPRAARALPPLLGDGGEQWADRVARGLGSWGWATLLFVPPLVALVRWRRAAPSIPAGTERSEPVTALGRLEREFLAVLASHVPDRAARDGDGLAKALRAAGLDSAVADHVMRLRDRLRAARYGPRGVGDLAELSAEIGQVLQVLGVKPGGVGRRRGWRGAAALGVLVLWTPDAGAQARSAEALYEAGALRAAADSFAARAEREPRVPAHWYNLGATLYRAGADGKAIAAWTRAARLAPRDPLIQRARRLLPPLDAPSEALLSVGPATPAEWTVLAAAAWLGLWGASLAGRRRVALIVAAALATASGVLGGLEARRRTRPVAVVTAPATPVRAAPYGSASPVATLEPGAALLAGRAYGPWLEVRRPGGVHGWVLAAEVARL